MFKWLPCCVGTYLSLTACVCVVADFKECFSLYDRQRKGKIEAQELITVMRCLGLNPTPAEVQRHLLSHNIGTALTVCLQLCSLLKMSFNK